MGERQGCQPDEKCRPISTVVYSHGIHRMVKFEFKKKTSLTTK